MFRCSSKTRSSFSQSVPTIYGIPSNWQELTSRLILPGSVIEDDDSSAKYDIASGILSIALSKVDHGEHFPDLDITNRLLARTGEIVDDTGHVKGPPRIQVINNSSHGPWKEGDFDEALSFDFQIPQSIPETTETTKGATYGFNNQYSGHFLHLQNPDILTIPNGEGKSALERWQTMRYQEDEKFDKDWYLADMFEPPDELDEILGYTLPSNLNETLNTEEQLLLRNTGTRECTFSSSRV
jgi:protein SHQ1